MKKSTSRTLSALLTPGWARRKSISNKVAALAVSSVYMTQIAACGAGSSEVGQHSDRLVTIALTGEFRGENDELNSVPITEDQLKLGDYAWSAREIVVDGQPTMEVEAIHQALEIVVPLRNGGTMTINRTGDVFTIVDIQANASFDLSKLAPVQITDGEIAVLGAQPDERTLLTVKGIDDIPNTKSVLSSSLGLDVLLAQVEDTDTVAPAVIAAAVAAVVGAAWMAACGITLYTCIDRCDEEFEIKCAFLDVEVDWPSVKVGGTLRFGCKCR